MRLAFVLRRFGGPGGTEKYAADLADWLGGRGVEIHVWCADSDGRARQGVSLHPLQVRGRGWAGERALLAAARALRLDDFDLVQGFGLTLGHHVFRAGGGAHRAWLEADGADSPWRRLRHRLSPRQRWICRVDREAARSARVVVCNSRMAADDVARVHGVERGGIRVVRNGVDGERFRPDVGLRAAARESWNVPEAGRVALFLGTGFRRKGLKTAVEAFARVGGSRDRLVVIGRDGGAGSRLGVARARLGERLVGWGPVDDPERWLPGADATILPTRYDAAANTTLESLACGVPPVTSARDGSAEVVPDPRLVVPDPRDAEGFAAALDWAWGAGPALASVCRETAMDWTVARNGMTMHSVYMELIDG